MNRCNLNRRSFPMMMAILAGGVGMSGQSARGQTLTWLNAAGGSIGTAANWNPAQVPGAGNTLLFNLAAAYPLTFPAGVATTANLTFTRGTQTLTISSPHTTGLVSIGNVNGVTGTVNLTTGTLNAGDVRLGTAFGSAGVLNVNDDDALLDCSQLSVASNTNQICTVNVTNSGRIEASSVVIGDDNPIGEGRVTVSGRTQLFPPLQSVLQTTGPMVVGRDGVGVLNVANGAFVDVGTAMTLGQNVSAGPLFSEGTVTVGGAGLGFPATLLVGSTLRIGRGTLAVSDTGNGTLAVNDDGSVVVDGATTVGGSGQGSGVLRVNSGGRFTSAGLSFGTSGDFQHAGGVVTVNGGGFTHDEAALTVSGAVDTSLVLDGLTAAVNFSAPSSTLSAITIGSLGTGSMTVRNGSDVNMVVGGLLLGNGGGALGTFALETGATLRGADNAFIVVGDEGSGVLTLRSGSSMDVWLMLVSEEDGSGTVVVENPGTTLLAGAAFLRLGASMAIRDGAMAAFDGNFAVQVPVDAGAMLTIENATLSATTDVDIDGSLTMVNGVINARTFKRSVPVSGSGTINAKIDAGAAITATGNLVLGDGGPLGFQSTDLVVGAHRVDLMDSNSAVLRNTTIAGGHLVAASALSLPAATALTGTGVVDGDVFNSGFITASGAEGLVFNGVITGMGLGIGGTKVTFGTGGGIVGAGIITSKVHNSAGARITITAPSLIGDSSPTGFTGGGDLDITGGLIINDSNGISLSGSTILRDADVSCASAVNLGTSGTLVGQGRILGALNSSGVISPGLPDGDVTGEIQVGGPYIQRVGGSAGELIIDIEGPEPHQSDLLSMGSHPATLDGILTIRVAEGFRPENGFRRIVLRSGGITNELDAVVTPPRFSVYDTQAYLVVLYCSADFNDDGFVDFFDYDQYVECFETGVCPGSESADFNGDGFVDFFDYDDFVLVFESGC